MDTTPHVSFYLHLLACLAAPNSLVSLFPDTAASGGAASEEAGGGTPPVAVKAAVLPEAIKAIYRWGAKGVALHLENRVGGGRV